MDAGKLKHRITFLAPVVNQDTYGQNVQTWTPVFTRWASVNQLRGALLAIAQAKTVTATATHAITLRYDPEITETMRIQFGADTQDDFDTLTIAEFDALTVSGFGELVTGAEYRPRPTIYTINSIIDPDSGQHQLNIIATVVRA